VKNVVLTNIQVHPSNGLSETLNQMRYLEQLSIQNPSFVKFCFDNFYSTCSGCIPGKIWNYIKKNFQYIDDDYDETIAAPYVLLEIKKGDCDDFALFSKTCLDILEIYSEISGLQKPCWNSSYLLLGRSIQGFTHIVCFAHRGKYLFGFNDPVVIDGANDQFNVVSNEYKFRKIV